MVTEYHVSASLRLLDADKHGIRTFSGVRRTLQAGQVAELLRGVSDLRVHPATAATQTVRTELRQQP